MTDFKVNDSVIHCREGLSKIFAINTINECNYFLVRAKGNHGETIYVPFSSANDIIRPIMTKKEADELLKYMKNIKKEFNTNTKQRRDEYKRKLLSGDVKEIAYLSRQIYFYFKIGGENNTEIKLGPVDFDMLNYAHNMLMDELALTYDKTRDEIESFVARRIAKL
ncbi:MAG TPA: hypothetical protein GX010_04280 [Erysipelotrichaceae bacterium]|nr:hypothetical protein [Erysipelotrichaceae bacterium]